jgi:hypothetical protein
MGLDLAAMAINRFSGNQSLGLKKPFHSGTDSPRKKWIKGAEIFKSKAHGH